MSRFVSSMAIAGSALAAVTALVLGDIAIVLPGLFGIGGGIALAISKDWRRIVPGLLAVVFGVLAILGTIGSVGNEDGAIEFGISVEMGVAFAILACMEFPSAAVLLRWGQESPAWLSYAFVGILALTDLLALVLHKELTNHAAGGTLAVGVLALAALWPSIVALRD